MQHSCASNQRTNYLSSEYYQSTFPGHQMPDEQPTMVGCHVIFQYKPQPGFWTSRTKRIGFFLIDACCEFSTSRPRCPLLIFETWWLCEFLFWVVLCFFVFLWNNPQKLCRKVVATRKTETFGCTFPVFLNRVSRTDNILNSALYSTYNSQLIYNQFDSSYRHLWLSSDFAIWFLTCTSCISHDSTFEQVEAIQLEPPKNSLPIANSYL